MTNGARVKMNPTDRSISPQISSSTSPIAMMMIGAANCGQQLMRSVFGEEVADVG